MGYVALTRDMGDTYIRDWENENARTDEFGIKNDDSSRTDPVLIGIIEKYGDANVHGCYAPRVIEVPDGVEWVVDEYDGFETLHEKHRIFG